ncbi:MAG: hypothetical protein QGG84_12315 [Rhodospirillales bacterium]|jgi:hypothetical protein|nr:hypothetical protein [Rhodospirillales bacterium]|tara:strand:- start:9 stop:146 length:138 start_codon:yes stop_codon:yes gene_type:complete
MFVVRYIGRTVSLTETGQLLQPVLINAFKRLERIVQEAIRQIIDI